MNRTPLEDQLSRTLDRSVDSLPPETRQALAQARQKALQSSHTPPRWKMAGGLALAAGLAAFAVTPWLIPSHYETPVSTPTSTAMTAVDPDMLQDMEMLDAIGEETNGV